MGCGGGWGASFQKSRFTSSANEAIASSAGASLNLGRDAGRLLSCQVAFCFVVLFPVSRAADPGLERVQFGFRIRMKRVGGGGRRTTGLA